MKALPPIPSLFSIDHNLTSPDGLIYASAGKAIVGASVRLLTTTGSLAGQAKTVAGGRWGPIMVAPGTYTPEFHLPGRFGPDRVTIVVDDIGRGFLS